MDPPPKPQGDPKENIQPGYSTSGDLTSLCFHPTPLSILWIPGQAPKSAGSGFVTSALRIRHKGEQGWQQPQTPGMCHIWSS